VKTALVWWDRTRPFDVALEDVAAELASGKLRCLGHADSLCSDSDRVSYYVIRGADHLPPSHSSGFPRESTVNLMFAVLRHATSACTRADAHDIVTPLTPPTTTTRSQADTQPHTVPQSAAVNVHPSNAGKIGVVLDLSGFGRRNIDRGVLKELAALVSQYFPGTVHSGWVVNAPLWIKGLWCIIRALVKPKWLGIITFVPDAVDLAGRVGATRAAWPREYGGDLDVDTVQWIQASTNALARNQPFVHAPLTRPPQPAQPPPPPNVASDIS
jgi:hypothetical protein